MKYDIIKSVSLLALFAAFTGVMFACGGSNDPSAPDKEDPVVSSSSETPILSSFTITENSPIRFQPPVAEINGNETFIKFEGSATLDGADTTTNADNDNDPVFTDVELILAYVNEMGQNAPALLQLYYEKPEFPRATVNLGAMKTSITDTEKTQCGTFKLYVVLKATNDLEIPDKFSSVDSVVFVRSAQAGEPDPEPVSSSAADAIESEAEFNQYIGKMSTSAINGFSFTEGIEVPMAQAQIRMEADENGKLTLFGVNGYQVAKYNNKNDKDFSDDWTKKRLPPTPAHISNFRFSQNKLAESAAEFDVDAFWVVVGPAFNADTGDDFFALTLDEKDIPNVNGDRPLTIIYYKK